jgi:hypothetical protein
VLPRRCRQGPRPRCPSPSRGTSSSAPGGLGSLAPLTGRLAFRRVWVGKIHCAAPAAGPGSGRGVTRTSPSWDRATGSGPCSESFSAILVPFCRVLLPQFSLPGPAISPASAAKNPWQPSEPSFSSSPSTVVHIWASRYASAWPMEALTHCTHCTHACERACVSAPVHSQAATGGLRGLGGGGGGGAGLGLTVATRCW